MIDFFNFLFFKKTKVQNGINIKNENVIIENDSGLDDKSKEVENITEGEQDYYFLIDQLDQFIA